MLAHDADSDVSNAARPAYGLALTEGCLRPVGFGGDRAQMAEMGEFEAIGSLPRSSGCWSSQSTRLDAPTATPPLWSRDRELPAWSGWRSGSSPTPDRVSGTCRVFGRC